MEGWMKERWKTGYNNFGVCFPWKEFQAEHLAHIQFGLQGGMASLKKYSTSEAAMQQIRRNRTRRDSRIWTLGRWRGTTRGGASVGATPSPDVLGRHRAPPCTSRHSPRRKHQQRLDLRVMMSSARRENHSSGTNSINWRGTGQTCKRVKREYLVIIIVIPSPSSSSSS